MSRTAQYWCSLLTPEQQEALRERVRTESGAGTVGVCDVESPVSVARALTATHSRPCVPAPTDDELKAAKDYARSELGKPD